MLRKFKNTSKEIETFRPSFPESARSELIGILNMCIPIKKYFSWNLLKLVRRAIQEVDLNLLKTLVEHVQLDFRQGQFKSLVTQIVVQQGWKDQQRLEDEMDIPGPSVQDYIPLVEYLLNDSTYGQMWLSYIDNDAYGNNLLHVCIELHNIDFTRLVLDKSSSTQLQSGGEGFVDLLSQRNGNGLTPGELLDKEIEKATNGVNPEKKARQMNLLQGIKNTISPP